MHPITPPRYPPLHLFLIFLFTRPVKLFHSIGGRGGVSVVLYVISAENMAILLRV